MSTILPLTSTSGSLTYNLKSTTSKIIRGVVRFRRYSWSLQFQNESIVATDKILTSHTIKNKIQASKSRMTYDSASSECSPLTPWLSELMSKIEGYKFIPLSCRELCFPRFPHIFHFPQISCFQNLASSSLSFYIFNPNPLIAS